MKDLKIILVNEGAQTKFKISDNVNDFMNELSCGCTEENEPVVIFGKPFKLGNKEAEKEIIAKLKKIGFDASYSSADLENDFKEADKNDLVCYCIFSSEDDNNAALYTLGDGGVYLLM